MPQHSGGSGARGAAVGKLPADKERHPTGQQQGNRKERSQVGVDSCFYLSNAFHDRTAAPAAMAMPYGRRRVKGLVRLSSGWGVRPVWP